MIVVTGAAGFIGSCMVAKLNQLGKINLVLVDDFSKEEKAKNFKTKKYKILVDRAIFIEWLADNANNVESVIHLGARTDTTEFDKTIFDVLNLNYTKAVWNLCSDNNIPLIYASSAATYGNGELGYDDDESIIDQLKPLNPYGESKNNFDIWAVKQKAQPPFWAGLKFFNVYGPNEYHKGRMASVILHTFIKVMQDGEMKLFKSHNPGYKDGEQLRDFVYVKDVVSVIAFLMTQNNGSGLYNLGTGKARSFNDLAAATFKALNLEPNISYIPTPEDIRDKYQYYTQANMDKLVKLGYPDGFTELEEGVNDYVSNYLSSKSYL